MRPGHRLVPLGVKCRDEESTRHDRACALGKNVRAQIPTYTCRCRPGAKWAHIDDARARIPPILKLQPVPKSPSRLIPLGKSFGWITRRHLQLLWFSYPGCGDQWSIVSGRPVARGGRAFTTPVSYTARRRGFDRQVQKQAARTCKTAQPLVNECR
jgi:hypothetical protein